MKNSGLNGDWNSNLCDTVSVLHQLSYQANWEGVVDDTHNRMCVEVMVRIPVQAWTFHVFLAAP